MNPLSPGIACPPCATVLTSSIPAKRPPFLFIGSHFLLAGGRDAAHQLKPIQDKPTNPLVPSQLILPFSDASAMGYKYSGTQVLVLVILGICISLSATRHAARAPRRAVGPASHRAAASARRPRGGCAGTADSRSARSRDCART